jgi:hypothetical protein
MVSSCGGFRCGGRAGCVWAQFWPFCLTTSLMGHRERPNSHTSTSRSGPLPRSPVAVLSGSTGALRSRRSASSALQQRANRPSRPHRSPSRELEAVRRTGIGALHVSVNTQVSVDQNLARPGSREPLSASNRWPGSTRSASSWIWNRPYVERKGLSLPLGQAKPRPFARRRGRTTTVRWCSVVAGLARGQCCRRRLLLVSNIWAQSRDESEEDEDPGAGEARP